MNATERKRFYRAYRRTAKLTYENKGMVNTENITVPENCTVQMLPEGAFVEMIVWVAKEHVLQSTLEQIDKEQDARVNF